MGKCAEDSDDISVSYQIIERPLGAWPTYDRAADDLQAVMDSGNLPGELGI
jgi:hypothetical protein